MPNSIDYYYRNPEKYLKRIKINRRRRNKKGLCMKCPNKLGRGKTKCDACMDLAKKKQKLIRQKRRDEKLCVRCGNVEVKTNLSCESCLQKGRDYCAKRARVCESSGQDEGNPPAKE